MQFVFLEMPSLGKSPKLAANYKQPNESVWKPLQTPHAWIPHAFMGSLAPRGITVDYQDFLGSLAPRVPHAFIRLLVVCSEFRRFPKARHLKENKLHKIFGARDSENVLKIVAGIIKRY
jgi:hypothetical protein